MAAPRISGMKFALLCPLLLALAAGVASCCCDPDDPNLYPVQRAGPPFHQDPNTFPADCRTPRMIFVPAGK